MLGGGDGGDSGDSALGVMRRDATEIILFDGGSVLVLDGRMNSWVGGSRRTSEGGMYVGMYTFSFDYSFLSPIYWGVIGGHVYGPLLTHYHQSVHLCRYISISTEQAPSNPSGNNLGLRIRKFEETIKKLASASDWWCLVIDPVNQSTSLPVRIATMQNPIPSSAEVD